MNIRKYDNKCVQLEDFLGDIYEGIACYNSIDYNEHEYGVREDGIQLGCFLFYNSTIKKIRVIKEFTGNYGKLEMSILDDGLDLISEELESEEDIHVLRLLNCLKDNLKLIQQKDLAELKELLKTSIKYNENQEIKEKAQKLLDIMEE